MTLGEQIAQLRKQKQMSQEDLAAALQLSRQAVSKWENGVSNPDTENLIRLTEIFGVDVNVLIGSQLEGGKDIAPIPQEQPPDQRKTVRLLSILLTVAVCTTALFGTLWAMEREAHLETLAAMEQQNINRWESVKLYHYVEGNREEVPLSKEDEKELSQQIWSYHYAVIAEDEIEIVYATPIVVEFVTKDTAYLWELYSTYTRYTEIWDGYTWNTYYKTDDAYFNWITTFIRYGDSKTWEESLY